MIDAEAFEVITHAGEQIDGRRPNYALAEAYYDGNHRLPYASERWKRAFREVIEKLRDNLMPVVVDSLVDRLKVSGFGVDVLAQSGPRQLLDAQGRSPNGSRPGRPMAPSPDGGPPITEPPPETDPWTRMADEARQRAASNWSYNRMDSKQREVHEEAVKKGDAWVLVWPDANGRACIYPNEAELVHLEYDPELPGHKLWAVKMWEDGKHLRANVYWPDRIEKYRTVNEVKDGARPSGPEGWEPHEVQTEPRTVVEDPDTGQPVIVDATYEPWPLPNPYGQVPVFHFRRRGKSGGYGVSELSDVIPVQDALNKALMDLMVTSEALGFPMRYLLGLSPEIDEETGEPKTMPDLKPERDAFWAFWGEQLQAGQFPAAELAQLIAEVNDHRAEVGRLSRTPPHLMFMQTGEVPSGEMLKVVEAPFTAKVEDCETTFGNGWEDVETFCLLVESDGAMRVMLSAEWVDAQPVSELEKAQRAEAWQRIGIPLRFILRKVFGFTDVEVEEIMAERLAQLKELAQAGIPAQPGGPPPPQLAGNAARMVRAADEGQRQGEREEAP